MGEGKLNTARLTYESRLQMLTDLKELNRLADMTSMITQSQLQVTTSDGQISTRIESQSHIFAFQDLNLLAKSNLTNKIKYSRTKSEIMSHCPPLPEMTCYVSSGT